MGRGSVVGQSQIGERVSFVQSLFHLPLGTLKRPKV
jgi:hypothetical protein